MVSRSTVSIAAVLLTVARGEDKVSITAAEYEHHQGAATHVLQHIQNAFGENVNVAYDFAGGSDYILDPSRDLYSSIYKPFSSYDTSDTLLKARKMVMPDYPSYEMYHPTSEQKGAHKKPLMSYYPCCHYAPPQAHLGISLSPALYSPKQNCRMLSGSFLQEHSDEHYFHQCSYGNPSGGVVDPHQNEGGISLYENKYLASVLVGRGNCVNLYFNQPAGSVLTAPSVDNNGNCSEPNRRQPHMLDAHAQPPPYQHANYRRLQNYSPERHYNARGYDYLLECSCLCAEIDHIGGLEYSRSHIGYN